MIRVYSNDNDSTAENAPIKNVINAEVDGPSHAYPTMRRSCTLREKYLLKGHGVTVLRLNLSGFGDGSKMRRKDNFKRLIQSMNK